MHKTIAMGALLVCFVAGAAWPQQRVAEVAAVDLTLSASPSVAELVAAGLEPRTVATTDGSRRSFAGGALTIRLPQGTYDAVVNRAEVGERGGRIRFLRLIGDRMTHDQAITEALRLHETLGVEPQGLLEWFEARVERPTLSRGFYSAAAVDAQPAISIQVRKSYDDDRPWIVLTELHWED